MYFCGDNPRDEVKSNAVLDTVRVYGKGISPPAFLWDHSLGSSECDAKLETVIVSHCVIHKSELSLPVYFCGDTPLGSG